MCEFCQSNSKHKVQEVSVNAHLHTPYSFSAFDTLTDALNRACLLYTSDAADE